MTAPSKTLKVGDRELVMSYAMKMELLRLVGGDGVDCIQLLITDLTARDLVIRRLFTDLKKPIQNLEELIDPFELDITDDQVDSILEWVMEHFSDFFKRALKTVEAVNARVNPLTTAGV